MSKIVNVALYRYKNGKQEHRVLNIPGTQEEMIAFIKKTIDSQGISIFNKKTVTAIEVRYKDGHKLVGDIVRLAFKGLSPQFLRSNPEIPTIIIL